MVTTFDSMFAGSTPSDVPSVIRFCSFCTDRADVNVNHILVCQEHVIDAQLIGS